MIHMPEKSTDFIIFLQNQAEDIQKITLSKPTKQTDLVRIHIKRINTKFYIEEFTKTQTFHKNVDLNILINYLESIMGTHFKALFARTQNQEAQLLYNKKGESTFIKKQIQPQSNSQKSQVQSQNRVRNYIIQEGIPVPFLVHLGVMNSEGKVISSKYDKFRQINRFVEFISDVVDSMPEQKTISIIDYGCGKSYLTFAIYHFLQLRNIEPMIIGLDLKKEVVDFCTKLAAQCEYKNLHFFCGDIASFVASKEIEQPDIVISLHACDTATDYALAQAVNLDAKAILAVPCCQHEINAKLKKTTVDTKIAGLIGYGIIKERFASLSTDVMRAQLLESAGYAVQILEFIDSAHTPKNLLIRAIKKTDKKPLSESYKNLKEILGTSPLLESLL